MFSEDKEMGGKKFNEARGEGDGAVFRLKEHPQQMEGDTKSYIKQV